VSVIAKGYRTNPGEAEWHGSESIILRDSIANITGQEPKSYPNHYAGDIRYPIRLLNVPAYGIGSLAGNFYGPNEWVDIDDLVKLTAVLIDTVQGWSK
jgi:acetylornithine deacetylase/succinyl-diaminopimelate desuccinylase-like protein